MTRKHEASDLLLQGLSVPQIARRMGISAESVLQYLYTQVGEGAIRRSDVLLAWPSHIRQQIEEAVRVGESVSSAFVRVKGAIDFREFTHVWALGEKRVYLGDLYEYIREIELGLHAFVRETLKAACGENAWWRAVPEEIRVTCVGAKERDDEPLDDPFCYTTFIHLSGIMDKNWATFSPVLPPGFAGLSKKDFASRMARLNRLRNAVMHPVRGDAITEEEFAFVRSLHQDWIKGQD